MIKGIVPEILNIGEKGRVPTDNFRFRYTRAHQFLRLVECHIKKLISEGLERTRKSDGMSLFTIEPLHPLI